MIRRQGGMSKVGKRQGGMNRVGRRKVRVRKVKRRHGGINKGGQETRSQGRVRGNEFMREEKPSKV